MWRAFVASGCRLLRANFGRISLVPVPWPLGDCELDRAFGLPNLVAHESVASLGWAVGKDSSVDLVWFGGCGSETRPIEVVVSAVHLVRDQVPLVKTDLTVDVVGCAPTVVLHVEDNDRMWMLCPRIGRARMVLRRLKGEHQL